MIKAKDQNWALKKYIQRPQANSLLIFYAFALQCMATASQLLLEKLLLEMAINSSYCTLGALAYFASLITYNIFS